MLSLISFLCGISIVYAQCNSIVCPNGEITKYRCNDVSTEPYHCDGTILGRGPCEEYVNICMACGWPCNQEQRGEATADEWFNNILKCQPGICTESPTNQPITPGYPTSRPSPQPTHVCAGISSESCSLSCTNYPPEQWHCDAESTVPCTNAQSVCHACCVADAIRENINAFWLTDTEYIFDSFCEQGYCPTQAPSADPTISTHQPSQSPTKTPVNNPTAITETPTATPTADSLNPTTSNPTLAPMEVIWHEPMTESTVDLTHWTVTNTQNDHIQYRDGSDGGCPPNEQASCWAICSGYGAIVSMSRSASTEGLNHIAFTFSIDPWSIKALNEFCELSYSIDDINWTPFGAPYTDDDHIVDERVYLDKQTWDVDSLSIKITPVHTGSYGESCCYLSNLYLSGLPIIPTFNPTSNPTLNPSRNPSFIPTLDPTLGPIDTVGTLDTDNNNNNYNNDEDEQKSETNNGIMTEVVAIGVSVGACIVLLFIYWVRRDHNKQQEEEQSEQDMLPSTRNEIALPMNTDIQQQGIQMVSTPSGDDGDGETHTEFPFPKPEQSLDDDSAKEEETDSDDDVIMGYHPTVGGPMDDENVPPHPSAPVEDGDNIPLPTSTEHDDGESVVPSDVPPTAPVEDGGDIIPPPPTYNPYARLANKRKKRND